MGEKKIIKIEKKSGAKKKESKKLKKKWGVKKIKKKLKKSGGKNVSGGKKMGVKKSGKRNHSFFFRIPKYFFIKNQNKKWG